MEVEEAIKLVNRLNMAVVETTCQANGWGRKRSGRAVIREEEAAAKALLKALIGREPTHLEVFSCLD